MTDTTFRIAGITFNGALIGGVIIPAVLVVLLVVWPYLDKTSVNAVGVWWAKERRRQNTVFVVIILLIVILTIVGTFLRGPYWNFYWPWESWPEAPRKF